MGKGDKKTKRGKITNGSYGNKRPRKTGAGYVAPVKPAKTAVKEDVVEEVKAPDTPKTEKKPAAKKTTAKKPAAKKTTEKKEPAKKAAPKKKEDKKEE